MNCCFFFAIENPSDSHCLGMIRKELEIMEFVHVSAGTFFFKEPINGFETDDSSKRNSMKVVMMNTEK